MNLSSKKQLFVLAGLLLVLVSCGGDDKFELKEVTFAHGLTDEMQAVDPGSEFRPDETIYLSVTMKGRPKEGIVRAKFYCGDTFITDAVVDLADANSDVLFSIGEDTYAGYTLTHPNPFPVSDDYRAELFYKDEKVGTYAFSIASPEE